MRVCVIGGGLSGSLLAWRLVRRSVDVELVTGVPANGDATALSGGIVRGFETLAEQRGLALDSLGELLGSPLLRRWSAYRRLGSTYVTDAESAAAAAEVEAVRPGSVDASDRADGWAGLPADAVVVTERDAGRISPASLRAAVLAELERYGVVRPGPVTAARLAEDLLPLFDRVVFATGSRTPRLLAAAGLASEDYRTKLIRYAVHEASGWLPTCFVDETSGLYGAPGPDGLLLGVPTSEWDAEPSPGSPLYDRAARVAARRFPRMRLGPAVRTVVAADCYTTPPVLALRTVPGTGGRLLTFTGGSGGAAKTALAASRRAAVRLVPGPTGIPGISLATSNRQEPRHDEGIRPMTSISTNDLPRYHAIGIGAGPANLSLAALHGSATDERMALFDRSPSPDWHATLLHPGVRMQTSWLKDLVSVVDPTHRLSFLNYLVTEGRLFAMLNAQFDVIPRREYMRYLAWAAHQLEHVNYGVDIDRICFTDDGFVVYAGGAALACSEHLVIGVGSRPQMPDWAAALPPERVFIADHLAQHLETIRRDRPIAVVGGGQTGIEAVLRLVGAGCTDVRWLGRRQWFQTIDDSPSANEFYRPAHQRFLQQLTRETRRTLIDDHKTTGDALTPGALKALYQANYDGMLVNDRFPIMLLPGRDVVGATEAGDDIRLAAKTPEKNEQYDVSNVVIAVGRENTPLPFDDDLRDRIDVDEQGEMILDADYSARWKGMNGHRIYVFNRARMSHGIPDANLTLLPVRAAIVLNSMFDRQMFEIKDDLCPVQWG